MVKRVIGVLAIALAMTCSTAVAKDYEWTFQSSDQPEREDTPRGQWFHTDWTGRGDDATATTYSK
ncbi:MAG: hypothetical protein P8010_10175 [Desulfosarcinaceae bacterium]